MLLEMNIENFAIITKLHLDFHSGMTALTGETGAGKSIIIDAMDLLAGGRGSTDYIRQGCQKCVLEGLFELPKQSELLQILNELGIESTDELLIIQREISISAKNICRVNGRLVNLTNLKRIGSFLVDIQGQNEHQDLLQSVKHLQLVDSFGSESFKKLLAEYQQAYHNYRKLEKKIAEIRDNEQLYNQRVDMLNFQKKEIAAADLIEGEEESLVEERDKLANFQKISAVLMKSHEILTADTGNSLDGIGIVAQEIQDISHLDPEYEHINENIQNAYYLLQDVSAGISSVLDGLVFDERRLAEVNDRLNTIHQLKRKYGESITDILSYYTKICQELAQSESGVDQLEKLQAELVKEQLKLQKDAEKLHAQRLIITAELEKAILQELAELYLKNTQFEVRFTKNRQLHERGFDELEFYLTTNPGEPLKPLVKVASGGELSRILLALKSIFAKSQEKTSIVFDEVDTGVSGRVAQAIAEKISKIAASSQVLCITHLPQVAACAKYQYLISKQVSQGRTQTVVKELEESQRITEIARMLSGVKITPLAMENAKEMLVNAGQLT